MTNPSIQTEPHDPLKNRMEQHKSNHLKGTLAWYKLQHIKAIVARHDDDAEIGRAVRELMEEL